MKKTKITETLELLESVKPRSHRRVELLAKLKALRMQQLPREIRRAA